MSSYSQQRNPAAQPDGLVLQKQLPSSQVPRFNPHGAQPEPKPKKPDYVSKGYSPSKSKKMKSAAAAMSGSEANDANLAYENMNIEELLIQAGAEFRNPEKIPGGWLPLEAYDDQTYDSRVPQNWLRKGGEGPLAKEGVGAHGLWQDKDKLCYWRKLRLFKYLPKSQRFEGYWEITKEKCRLARIFIIFDEENPKQFVQRFKCAYQNRVHADALIKYNYYIENMPRHQIPEVDNYQVNRILAMTQTTKALRGKSSADTTTLLNEINIDFAKTMNNIIFDKHLFEKGTNLITGPLNLPPRKEKKQTPYLAMIQVPGPRDYPLLKATSKFTFRTFYNRAEVGQAQREIVKECNDVAEKEIFNTNFTKTITVDDFTQIQSSSISQAQYYLKETWVSKLKDIIKNNNAQVVDPITGQITPWFNLQETSKDAYEASKLKKFLRMNKYLMQNTILEMTKASVNKFVDALVWFLPKKTVIQGSGKVINEYFTPEETAAMGASKDKFPLFQIDLLLVDNKVQYNHRPQDIVNTIYQHFRKGLVALQEIPQLEQKIMPALFKQNHNMYLEVPLLPEEMPAEVDPEDKRQLPDPNTWLFFEFERLRQQIAQSTSPLMDYIETFAKFTAEYALDPDEEIEKLQDEENQPEPKDLEKMVRSHQEQAKQLREDIPESCVVSMFRVSSAGIRDVVAEKHEKIASEIIEIIAKKAKKMANETMEAFDKVNMQIESQPKDIEELSRIKDFMQQVPNEIQKLKNEIASGMKVYGILESFQYQFGDDEDYDKQWRLYGSPCETYERIAKQGNILEKEKDKFVNIMESEQQEFENKVEEIAQKVAVFDQNNETDDFERIAKDARDLHKTLQDANNMAKLYNNREALTGRPETSYDNIKAMIQDFQPFFELWNTYDIWQQSMKSWLNDDFTTIDATQLEETVDVSLRTLNKNIKVFRTRELNKILKICETAKEKVGEFQPSVDMIMGMLTVGMKDRHWEAISAKVGFEVKPYEGFTLTKVQQMNLIKWSDDIVDIGDRAGKEYQIETQLAKMKSEWENVFFMLKDFKKSGTSTVVGFDDAMTILDEHIVMTQAMQFSSFKKPFEEEIEEWNTSLLQVSDVIDEWLKVQKAWMYLQPIFDSNDIMKQLPGDSKKFKGVDKQWREIITKTKANPNVLACCTQITLTVKEQKGEPTEKALLDGLRMCNDQLDIVSKRLKDYLESKCGVFARFYFLSADELLQILSQTKEVKNVRPHLKKVFENMADLEFQPDTTITAMMSGEKEKIEMLYVIDPRDKNVENWMCEVEESMYKSIRHVLKYSITNYDEIARTDWILRHPGQCVLNGSQVHWTRLLEEAALADGDAGVKGFYDKLGRELLDTVGLVRKPKTKLQRITLEALIVIDVHAKDVVQKLVDLKISDITAFEWVSQLRYYWENDDCMVKCIQTVFPYGYEYLGNTGRLVITALTDKCYMTLMGALKLNLGGAPAGPAGTGKTESTKDLAKALAKQCVVFNCSDGMDHLMIAKFFKGLAAAGAWCCFDEFNRINVEVLSVIAQQLLELFGAKAINAPEIDFAGSHIFLKPTFCVFITMNPGYAGRTELPDNLKALFRPVAMMVPNYAVIAEIMLYSFGYNSASLLANKMVTTFTLSSEQLSSQDHYDYGMRAVRSVINAAGILKAQFQEMDEDQLLLRALRDVNVPKFLKDDLPLFENIISDLFPGVKKPAIDRGALLQSVKEICKKTHLVATDSFVEKVFQLYDTTTVRHGLMIVGPTGGGKTSCYKTLSAAQTALAGNTAGFVRVNYHILNPKSITQDQLYGCVDGATGEWTDGIAAIIVSTSAADPTDEKHWVMFDGPVDALWIESMNTVLDDNKKLCLNSGQIIPLSNNMTMMFEVEDLAVASPATVSRCGMVYIDPNSLGVQPLIDSWLTQLPDPVMELRKTTVPILTKIFDRYLEPSLTFVRRNCPEPVQTANNNLVQSCTRILDCYLDSYKDTDAKKVTEAEIEELEKILEPLFIFALIWSLGCTTTLEGREKFSEFIRQTMGKDNEHRLPHEGTVYDYKYVQTEKQWVRWDQTVSPYTVDQKAQYQEIIVPTFDSIRMKYVKRILLMNGKNVLCPGLTGTGKTVNISLLINQEMPEEFACIPITFSAQTSANQTQEALDEKFEKKRKGVYGPPTGKKFCIFIDDLNMPKKETYGAQPPIELIRQWMDHQGWYDLVTKEKDFRKIIDIMFVSAMGPPGGGRSPITARLQRHYNIIAYTVLGVDSVSMIFKTILQRFLGPFEQEVSNQIDPIVKATMDVYNGVEEALKPTPTKSHYTFNLRDMSKIFQGLCAAHNKTITTKQDLLRLWVHENMRVFGDRMINDDDRETLKKLLWQQSKQRFQVEKDQIMTVDRIIFGDYLFGNESDNRPYQLATDIDVFMKRIAEYLEDYNAGSKHPMKLVMFLDACDHVSRICRVLRQPLGNALLLGVGGSGRQSLSKLATYISNYKLYQIEVVKGYAMRDWRDNVKSVLMQSGVEGKQTTFLFVDTQIINEQMLEDINNVLNSGDVPGLYKTEDLEPIYAVGKTECARKNLQLTKMNMLQCYLSRVKQNIHMVIAMSPLGEVFRTRLRMFPSLVNCCTIDWFTNWPTEALLDVAKGFVQDGDLDLGDAQGSCIEMFKEIHQSVEEKVVEFKDVHRRISYVTPTSYLELLSMYSKILKEKRKENDQARNRLVRGLDVLKEAQIEVDQLQKQLEKDQPELERTQIIVEEKKKDIAEQTVIAEEKAAIVQVEEAEALKKEAEVRGIKDEADGKLSEALPALEKAVAQVKKIEVKDFYDLKVIQKPNPSCVTCFKLVCWFLLPGVRPTKPNSEADRAYDAEGYFFDLTKKRLLDNPKRLLNDLIEYKKDEIQDALIAKVAPVMEQEEMAEAAVARVSKALVPVRVWITAMIKYHATLKIVAPLRETARVKGAELAEVQAALAEKQAAVKAIMDKLEALNKEMADLVAKAAKLEKDLEDCKKKLVRADKMITGLADSKGRWEVTVKELTESKELIIGNCMIAAGMVSYAGPFISQYREQLESFWRSQLAELHVPITKDINMRQVLGKPVTLQQWGVAGLPSDNLSVENGIIMFGSRRWPLMIDPQTQANKFIKKLGSNTEGIMLDVFKLSESNLIRVLELAIQFGRWVLLENIGEEIDPALEPILLQQKIKQGNSWMIKLGERSIQYNDNFKFFMTTTIPNPHYSPETSVKVTILNFSITPVGLEEQMLNLLVLLEMPELQEKKTQIVEDNARFAAILYDLEDKILAALSEKTVAQLLDTDDLIDLLADSQKTSTEIATRQAESKITEKEIDVKREGFRPVAFRSQLLFFGIIDLNNIDPMYQYSLQWFQNLFKGSVQNSEQTEDVEKRIEILNDYFTESLYKNVCRSLFEMHKLLFSFLLTMKILFGDDQINMAEWRFFLAGPSGQIDEKPNPTQWLDDLEWQQTYKQLHFMDQNIPVFKGIEEYFINFNVKFKKIFDSPDAHREPMPGDWNNKLNSFQKMILLKSIRLDKITMAIQEYITEKIGQKYIEPPTFKLSDCFLDSDNCTPLVFVLSQGSDPIGSVTKFVEEKNMGNGRFQSISLGSGQDKPAEAMIEAGKTQGNWVLLANCHLCISWMPKLEAIVEKLEPTNHPDFRLWLTSSPTPKFPVAVLQNSVKMTMEPPSGLRANLLQTYGSLDNKILNDCQLPVAFKKLLFAFSLFHAIVQDRRKFGPIGWNIPYAFTAEDFMVCQKQLKIFLDEAPNEEVIPYQVLNFLGAQVNYGGRVTDDRDVRLITSILGRFVNKDTIKDDFKFSESGIYKTIQAGSQSDYLDYIKALPLNPGAEAFGLHDNAQITTNQNEARIILENVLSIQPRQSSSGGVTREQVINDISVQIESKTPEPFDIFQISKDYPTDYNESMNTVLTQEILRYNKLLTLMKGMLVNVQKALRGEVVMSDDLEKMSNSLFDNQVPIAWSPPVGFLSLKPLASWIIDLSDRITFLQKWVDGGSPATFWISGFFFPQAFFTGTLQNYARKHVIAIDQLSYEFKVYDEQTPQSITEKPEDGCLCHGMYIEGARWNSQTHLLDDSNPKQLYSEFPLVWFLPKKDRKKPDSGIYDCPVYKVLSRTGTLSTTGHSTNFCLYVELPTREDQDKWIRAGVACFLALRY